MENYCRNIKMNYEKVNKNRRNSRLFWFILISLSTRSALWDIAEGTGPIYTNYPGSSVYSFEGVS